MLISRKGRIRSKPDEWVNAKGLKGAILERVDKNSRILTDEWKAYNGIGGEVTGGHGSVIHALLERGVHGIFRYVSREHLGRYCNEFSFRWNYRKVTNGERTIAAIREARGKRLMYFDSSSQAETEK